MHIDWERILNDSGVSIVGIDVGCSSGRPHQWARLGSALKYLGIDPLETEINRLNSLQEANSLYLATFIDFEGADGKADAEASRVFERTSAAFAQRSGFDNQKEIYNAGSDVSMSNKKMTVSQIKAIDGFSTPDLIKIDIDGGDFRCLKAFSQHGLVDGLISLTIESQFHGDSTDDGNTLWNIGRLANSKGLGLYDLDINRYSRHTLPSKYIYDFPAQTHYGQALWGDSLFINETLSPSLDIQAILKLASVFEIYSFFDCALELFESQGESLMKVAPVKEITRSLRLSHEAREAQVWKSSPVFQSRKHSRIMSSLKNLRSRKLSSQQ
jgi:hypothetical protein